jgi:6-pyruvoyl-tetrahydropterin synthase
VILGGGEPDPVFGWTHNLDDVEPVIEGVRRELDRRYLNDIEGLTVPTLENVTAGSTIGSTPASRAWSAW